MILTMLMGADAPESLLVLLQEPTPFVTGGDSGASFFLMLVETMLALGLVCGLAYALFRWVLPRLQMAGIMRASDSSMVRIVDRVGLDARKNLYVIEVAGRWLLIAASEAGVQLVSELDAANAEEAAQAIERLRPTYKAATAHTTDAPDSFANRFARLMNRRKP
ncbi:MAG TPA: flagellar biosynthetic protein FliO [Pyrinomonadaceae bacterium]|jgi:flagellar protein FliO/FliZ